MNNDKGFSLIEVLVALVVVSIVSTSLLQMFVTSTKINTEAQLMDIANNVSVQQAEKFKSDPENYSTGYKYSYYYYKRDGTHIPPVYHELGTIPDEAVIQVKSDVHTPIDLSSSSSKVAYHPYFDLVGGTFILDGDYDVNIQKNTDTTDPANIIVTYKVDVKKSHEIAYHTLVNLDSSSIKNNTLSIGVNSNFDTTQRTIKLTNNSNLEVDFYILNGMYNDKSSTSFVDLDFDKGSSSNIFYVPVASAKYMKYALTLTVSRLKKLSNGVIQVEEMFRYSDSDDPDDLQNLKKSSIYKYTLTN